MKKSPGSHWRKFCKSASKDLGLTQTGVTQRIRSLESNLEATLFTRSRRGMRLTQEGEALRKGEVQFAIIPPEMVTKEMDTKLLKPEQYALVQHNESKMVN